MMCKNKQDDVMKWIAILSLLPTLISTQTFAKSPTPSAEDILRAKATLSGWCQTLESLRKFQDERKWGNGDIFVEEFITSELERIYPHIPLSEKIIYFNATCNRKKS